MTKKGRSVPGPANIRTPPPLPLSATTLSMITSSGMPAFRLAPLLLLGFLLTFSNIGFAQADFEKNVRLLKSADDFRVRTQAALTLGASGESGAVTPLCQALSDPSRTVRIASATGLSRLKKGGGGCLKSRLTVEKDERVLASIKKALERVSGAGPEPAIDGQSKYYVAIEPLLGPERLQAPFRVAMVGGIGANDAVAVAPEGESLSQAEKVLQKHPKATGFLLSAKALKPSYDGGTLKITISVAILTYPGKAILGTFTQTVGMGGISGPDPKAEEELMASAAEAAMKKFLSIAPSLAP